MTHTATLRPGVVRGYDPRTGRHAVFESNFVMECSCGRKIGYATTSETTAQRWMAEHLEWHERFPEEDR